jgi:hypothetical protein
MAQQRKLLQSTRPTWSGREVGWHILGMRELHRWFTRPILERPRPRKGTKCILTNESQLHKARSSLGHCEQCQQKHLTLTINLASLSKSDSLNRMAINVGSLLPFHGFNF